MRPGCGSPDPARRTSTFDSEFSCGAPGSQHARSAQETPGPEQRGGGSPSSPPGLSLALRGPDLDAPPPRTKWTRRVPHPVLIGHVASLSHLDVAAQDLVDHPLRLESHHEALGYLPRDRPRDGHETAHAHAETSRRGAHGAELRPVRTGRVGDARPICTARGRDVRPVCTEKMGEGGLLLARWARSWRRCWLRPAREGGSECTVGTRVGATVGRGGGRRRSPRTPPRDCAS